MTIRAEYDNEANALYLWLTDAEVARTIDRGTYAVDLDAEGRARGVELVNILRSPSISMIAAEWEFVQQVDEARSAIAAALPNRTYAVNTVHATAGVVITNAATVTMPVRLVESESLTYGDPSRQAREPEPV